MAALSSAPGLEVTAIAANATEMTKSPSAVAAAPHIGPHRHSNARNAATLSMPKPNRAVRAARTRSTERRTMRRNSPLGYPELQAPENADMAKQAWQKIVLSVDHAPDQDAEDKRPQNAGKRTAGNAFFGVLGKCRKSHRRGCAAPRRNRPSRARTLPSPRSRVRLPLARRAGRQSRRAAPRSRRVDRFRPCSKALSSRPLVSELIRRSQQFRLPADGSPFLRGL